MQKPDYQLSAGSESTDHDSRCMDPDAQLHEILLENDQLRNQLEKEINEKQSIAKELKKTLDERQKWEQSYKENREIYLLAIDATNLGIYDTEVKDEDFRLKENWLARLGYDPTLAHDEELTWESLIHPDDFERVTKLFKKEANAEIRSLNMEYRLRAANGEYRWIIESSKIIDGPEMVGKVRIVGTHFDITKRKLAEEAEREQRAFAEALAASTAAFNSTLNLQKLLNLILVNLGKVIPHDDADIWLINKNMCTVQPTSRIGLDGNLIQAAVVPMELDDIPIFQEMIRSRKTITLPNIQADSCPIPTRNPNSKSCICVPIVFNELFLGFLVLNSSDPNFFTPIHIERLQAFANQAAVAIRNAQLYAQAQEAAALEERQRLAREMHDVISQTLFSATIKAEALPYLFELEEPEKVKQNLAELHRLTRGALAEMRTMLMELRPNTLTNTDFSNLLHQMTEGLAGRTTADIRLSTEGRGLLPPEVQTGLFRITQESINNILKHSKANTIEISYKNQKDLVTLMIRDNGIGCDLQNISAERMGVRIMRERAESIRAEFEMESQVGHGTVIKVRWNKTPDERV